MTYGSNCFCRCHEMVPPRTHCDYCHIVHEPPLTHPPRIAEDEIQRAIVRLTHPSEDEIARAIERSKASGIKRALGSCMDALRAVLDTEAAHLPYPVYKKVCQAMEEAQYALHRDPFD